MAMGSGRVGPDESAPPGMCSRTSTTTSSPPEGRTKKSDREIMEILESFDATQSAHSAAQLAGGDPKTVRRYAAAYDHSPPTNNSASLVRSDECPRTTTGRRHGACS